MARPMTLVILSASMMALSMAQTFQYSRGWTNGKRDGNPSQFIAGQIPADFSVVRNAGNPIADVPTPCQIEKLKMLLRGTAAADQLYFMPCEIFETPRVPSIVESSPTGRFRRSSSSPSQDNENSYQ